MSAEFPIKVSTDDRVKVDHELIDACRAVLERIAKPHMHTTFVPYDWNGAAFREFDEDWTMTAFNYYTRDEVLAMA